MVVSLSLHGAVAICTHPSFQKQESGMTVVCTNSYNCSAPCNNHRYGLFAQSAITCGIVAAITGCTNI